MRQSKKRAVSTLEFVMILPMFILLITFMVDISRVLMISSGVNNAASKAARDAAIRGGTQVLCGTEPCFKATFNQAIADTPGTNGIKAKSLDLEATSGQQCSSIDAVVSVKATYDVDLLTPGLSTVLGLTGGFKGLTSVGVARCEVEFR